MNKYKENDVIFRTLCSGSFLSDVSAISRSGFIASESADASCASTQWGIFPYFNFRRSLSVFSGPQAKPFSRFPAPSDIPRS